MIEEEKVKKLVKLGSKYILPGKMIDWRERLYKKSIAYDVYDVAVDALKIMEGLYNNVSVDLLARVFNDMDAPINYKNAVRRMVFEFSSKGPLFFEATNKKVFTSEEYEELTNIKRENRDHIIATSKLLINREKLSEWERVLKTTDIFLIEDCLKVMLLIQQNASQREVQLFIDQILESENDKKIVVDNVKKFCDENLGRVEVVMDNNSLFKRELLNTKKKLIQAKATRNKKAAKMDNKTPKGISR